MARKRMIDPGVWQSEDFSKLNTLAKLVFIGLFSNADDEGRGRAKAAYIKSILFPYDEEMLVTDIDAALTEIAAHMSVTFYISGGNEYYSLDNWSKWQRIDRPSPSVLPEPDERSIIIRHVFAEGSENTRRVVAPKEKEENIKKDNQKEKGCEIPPRYVFPTDVKNALLEWLNYKSERGESYKSAGLEKLCAQIEAKLKGGGGAEIIRAVSDSMACNYSGIIWSKSSAKPPQNITLSDYEISAQRVLDRVKATQAN